MCQGVKTDGEANRLKMVPQRTRMFIAASFVGLVFAMPASADEHGPFCGHDEQACTVTALDTDALASNRAGQGVELGVANHPGVEYAVTLWDELKLSRKSGDTKSKMHTSRNNVAVSVNGH